MNRRPAAIAFVLAWIALARVEPASAHRLDEYLQATRFSIARDRLDMEMDLTPGISVAPEVLASIDTNHDGRVSSSEGAEYANVVFQSLEVSVDGVPIVLKVVSQQFPELAEMNAGVGMIRLRGTAALPVASAGRHKLFYRNSHEPKISVYLANALVPTDKQIAINGQGRDSVQQELTIDYRVISASSWRLSWALMLGSAVAVGLCFTIGRFWARKSPE